MPIGDCLKGAASDALTKCASLLGVGLDLYGITAQEKRESLGGSNGNGNHGKADVKRLIDQAKGLTMQSGEDAFRYFIKALNQSKTAQEVDTLRQYVESFLNNNGAA